MAGGLWAIPEAASARIPIAQVSYLEGSASIIRSGSVIAAPDPGMPLCAGDLLSTAVDGRLTIDFAEPTCASGTLSMRPSTALCPSLGLVAGEKCTVVELFTGSVGAKVKKIAGKPSFVIQAENSAAGVRGTEFEVAAASTDASIVIGSSGSAIWSDKAGTTFPVPARMAAEDTPSRTIQRWANSPSAGWKPR